MQFRRTSAQATPCRGHLLAPNVIGAAGLAALAPRCLQQASATSYRFQHTSIQETQHSDLASMIKYRVADLSTHSMQDYGITVSMNFTRERRKTCRIPRSEVESLTSLGARNSTCSLETYVFRAAVAVAELCFVSVSIRRMHRVFASKDPLQPVKLHPMRSIVTSPVRLKARPPIFGI
jgi:hypothetical protein